MSTFKDLVLVDVKSFTYQRQFSVQCHNNFNDVNCIKFKQGRLFTLKGNISLKNNRYSVEVIQSFRRMNRDGRYGMVDMIW